MRSAPFGNPLDDDDADKQLPLHARDYKTALQRRAEELI